MKYDEFGGIIVEDNDNLDELGGVIVDNSSKPSTNQKQLGYIDRIKGLIDKSKNDDQQLENDYKNKKIGTWDYARKKVAEGFRDSGEITSEAVKPVLQGAVKAFDVAMSPVMSLRSKVYPEQYPQGKGPSASSDMLNSISQDLAPAAQKTVGKYGEFKKTNPKLSENIDDLATIGIGLAGLSGAGMTGKAIGGGLKETAKVTGKTLEGAGKKFALGELKITNPVAKKAYGKDLADKKQTIVNDIAEFGVTKGNHEEMAADALIKAQERFNKADEIVTQLAADPNTKLVNPIEVARKGIDLKSVPYGKREQVQKIIDGITNDMMLDGFDRPVTIDNLIKAKQNIDLDGKTFKSGPASSMDDALEQAIRKKMYLNIVDEIGSISPEIKAMNQEGKRLLDVNAALTGAASREANKNAIGLTDWIIGGASIANPGTLAATVPLIATKKMLGSGRGSNLLINTGRTLQGKGKKTIEESLANIKNSEPVASPPISKADLPSTSPTENLDIPTYQRRGVDIDAMQSADDAQMTAQRAASLRITPDRIAAIERQLADEEAAKQAAEAAARGRREAVAEQDVYLENLEKPPVITIDRLKAMRDFEKFIESGKKAKNKAPETNVPGDVASWKILGDNYQLPDPNKPKGVSLGAMLKNERGAVGGGAVNPQVKSENFKRWFGDWEKAPEQASKVVDESGKPLVVYHGTPYKAPSNFSSGATRGTELAYFTPDKTTATKYALGGGIDNDLSYRDYIRNSKDIIEKGKISPSVMPVYIDIKKPLDPHNLKYSDIVEKNNVNKVLNAIEDSNQSVFEDIRSAYDDSNTGLNFEDWFKENADELMDGLGESIIESNQLGNETLALSNAHEYAFARAFGLDDNIRKEYDGLIYLDNETGTKTIVPFSPTQIKSATGNSGAFSPTNPDIRGSSALGTLGITGGVAGGGLTAAEILRRKQNEKKKGGK